MNEPTTVDEWSVLIRRLADVKTEQYKKDFIADLIRGTLTGEYQWEDPRPYNYYIKEWRFSIYWSKDKLAPLSVYPDLSSDVSIDYEISESDRNNLIQAIDLQMVNREERRVKSTLPRSGGVKKSLFQILLHFIQILFGRKERI